MQLYVPPVSEILLLSKPTSFESGSGIGVNGEINGQKLALGNTALMKQLGISVNTLIPQARGIKS